MESPFMRGWWAISFVFTGACLSWYWGIFPSNHGVIVTFDLVFLDTSPLGVITSISIATILYAFVLFQHQTLDDIFNYMEFFAGASWYPIYWVVVILFILSGDPKTSFLHGLFVLIGFPALIFTALMGIPVLIVAIYLSFRSVFSVIFKIFSGLWSAGVWVYTLFIRVPGTDIAQKHASNIHPSDTTERRLAQAVREGSASDREIAQYSHTFPFWSRRLHTFKYRKKAEKYRKVNKLLKEQKIVVDARTEMAYHAHELEKAKRKLKNAKKSYK